MESKRDGRGAGEAPERTREREGTQMRHDDEWAEGHAEEVRGRIGWIRHDPTAVGDAIDPLGAEGVGKWRP